MPTHPGVSNVFTRVLKLETASASATAFTVDIDGRQYLVTARHVLPNVGAPSPVRLTGHMTDCELDATPLKEPITPTFSLPARLDGIAYGQEVYFYGYPYGLASTARGAERLPLVKRALLSAMTHEESGAHLLYLDGFNNPGFSGGPVVFVPQGGSSLHVGAVISGYRIDRMPVHGAEADSFVQGNSGIIVAYSIEHVLPVLG